MEIELKRRLNWIQYRLINVDGYGRYGRHFITSLLRLGVDIYPLLCQQLDDLPAWTYPLIGYHPSNLSISLMPGYEVRETGGRQWNYTMYEGTRLEKRWLRPMQRAERVLVPHSFLVEVLRDLGVRQPIHVIPGGTCPLEFPVSFASPYERTGVYTFLALGDRGNRKGWDLVWNVFGKVFSDEPNVRLIIKSRAVELNYISSAMWDRRVTFIREDLLDMNAVYDLADCFVFPSRGEGWGMPPREFAMTGKPAIVTRWSGLEAGIDEWALPLNDFMMVPSSLPGDGEWAFPNRDEIAERMTWCFEHREEARQKGLEAAVWLRANQTWQHAAQKLIDLVNQEG